ncbi:CRISPR-associated protein Csx11 [Thermodesulfatator autotrophicus]|uniref:CRISPR-associated protein Csx11 n=1 Tax=Thermodesulfatator autotrophicus TaxID=1795632 RepID=A0A177EAV0_9BACT|nr:CRISPR-associated protein Csx11 [Thermodesulfatator autotrophicus]OAG28550.1 hypothetical protein TH606_00925 [Thermodesulfatator autotrophicus]
MPDLKDLRDKREEILKAELAAWLHDVGKCADAFLQPGGMGFNAQNCQGQPRVNPHKAVFNPTELQSLPYWNSLSPQRGQCARLEEANHPTALWRTLQQIQAQLPNLRVSLGAHGAVSLKELILWGRPLVAQRYNNFINILGGDLTHLAGILGQAHKSAHMEKEDDADGGQSSGYSSPFGWYIGDFENLNEKLKNIIENSGRFLNKRGKVIQVLKTNMQKAPGDTRRPINEVTLWDWSSIVAALYKAEVARCVLKQGAPDAQRSPNDVKWRLLSIRTDGLSYLLSAISIPDMLARKDILKDAWDRVQKVIEETYPLGLEVYRDENGSVFVVPDMDVLGLTDYAENCKSLRQYLLGAFQSGTVKNNHSLSLQGEIVPVFNLDDMGWSGQGNDLPPIGQKHLREVPPLQSDPTWVAQQWCDLPKPREVCPVCGLRPQGPSQKALARKMCDVCEGRRADRAKEWAVNIGQALLSTIWIDEVADRNGRVALLVGTFDLRHWLDGTLVRSLAVRNPQNVQDKTKTEDIAKNPSFARLRRIWETTRKFWEETLEEARGELTKRPRIFLKGTPAPQNALAPYHAYELEIQGRKVAVLWVPENATDDKGNALEYRGGFWVIENLYYLDSVYGRSFHELVKSSVGQPLKVYEPTEYGRAGEERASFTIAENGVQYLENNYTSLIPILAEPRTFMALVPADKAFEVVKAIKTKYEREMGKVRNRLPLHLGAVFADSHQPLRTLLDAGRRMLKQEAPGLLWRVVGEEKKQKAAKAGIIIEHITETKLLETTLENEHPALIYRNLENEEKKERITNQFKRWHRIVLLSEGHFQRCVITWYIPAVMGDGQTEDHWYPYVFLAQKDEPTDRTRYYKTDLGNPWNASHPWLVHAGELKPGDRIYFTPSTFDFEFLDFNARRFEIAYDEGGKRKGSLTKPYFLDEIENLERLWKFIAKDTKDGKSRLSSSQIFAIRNLIETKREEWFDDPQESIADENFKRFCRDLFVNAEWRWGKPEDSKLDWLTDMTVRGYFTDAVYLFHNIMKEKVEGNE